jgi:hypothetical protein
MLLCCRFCFFDKASQVDNSGGHETSLGLWKGFEKGGTEVRQLLHCFLAVTVAVKHVRALECF